MYYPGEQQFIEETLLIEKLAMMDVALVKEAGALTDMLGGISESIKTFSKQYIDTSSIESTLASIGNIMVPAMIFRVNPWLGILSTIASTLGFNTSRVIEIIKGFVSNKISKGERPTPEEITNIGMNAVGSEVGGSPDAAQVTASNDMFDILKQAELEGGLIKLAQGRGYFSEQTSGPFLFPRKNHYGNRGIIGKIFGGLGRTRGKWLLGGFVVWVIKTILAGAGLLAVAGVGASLLTNKTVPAPSAPGSSTAPQAPMQAPVPIAPARPNFVWSGRGGQIHLNDNKSVWYVPMRDVNRTLLGWTIDVYPEVSLRAVSVAPSFRKLMGELQGLKEPASPYIRIPSRFKTRKQIIDSFINEVSV